MTKAKNNTTIKDKDSVVLIGDIHGKFVQLKPILESTENEVICVGDVGIGFYSTGSPFFRKNFKFIRGNHDNPAVCRAHHQYLGDFAVHKGIFFLGGAKSVDAYLRIEGRDWWRDEHLSQPELEQAVELYRETKPDIVVSHDCPWEMQAKICKAVNKAFPYTVRYGAPSPYPTTVAMDIMLAIHRPKLHVYGHWHLSHRVKHKGTTFICLNELETLDLKKEMDSL